MWKSKGIKLALVSLVILVMLMAGGCFNKPPEITSLTPSSTSVARGESCTVTCVATDPDTDTITYAWTATAGAISGTGSTITWMAPTTEGSYSVTVAVSDGKADAVSDSCNIQVVNTPPVIANLTPSTTDLAPEDSCTVGCVASDADGDTLTYAWTATGGTITGTGNSVSWEAPAAEGTYTISVSVSDGNGGTASDSVDIIVEMKYGAIDIQSDPAGAAVFLNGVDTGNITPYVITNLTPGSYTVMLDYYHYKYRYQTVTVTANDTAYLNWSLTYAPELTLTLQPNDVAGKDAYVYDPTPDTNYGTHNDLYAGARALGILGICRSYLQFSLNSLPDDVVIVNARLGLYYFYNEPGNAVDIGLYRVREAWNETAITWDDQPTFDATLEDTHLLPSSPTSNFHYWYITDMVTSWYDGILTNYGLMLKSPNEPGWEGWTGFYSSDRGTASQRPKLVISYYDPNP